MNIKMKSKYFFLLVAFQYITLTDEQLSFKLCGNFPMLIYPFNNTIQTRVMENSDYGYTRAVAMRYAIEKYEKQYKATIPPIEYHYFSMTERNVLYLADQFICDFQIGPYSSENTERALSLYNLLGNNLVFISHGATSHKLSKRPKYPKLFRTVPDDENSANILITIAKKYKWTNVATMYTLNDAALSINEQFNKKMKKIGACITQTILKDDGSINHYKDTLTKVINDCYRNNIKVVFFFLSHQGCFSLFEVTKYLDEDIKMKLQHLQLVLDSNCATNIPINKEVRKYYKNMITLQTESVIPDDFKEYFMNLENVLYYDDPFVRLLQSTFSCKVCPRPTLSKIPYNELALVTPVFQAVKVIYKAINVTCSNNKVKCKNMTLAEKLELRKLIFEYLNKYKEYQRNNSIHFEIDGGVSSNFDIFQLTGINHTHIYVSNTSMITQNSTGNFTTFKNTTITNYTETFEYKKVGCWNYRVAMFDTPNALMINADLPPSTCSEECKPNQVQIFNKTSQCCWTCENCTATNIVQDNKCVKCALGTKANHRQLECKQLPVYTISRSHWVSVIVVIISAMFLIFAGIILLIYLKNYSSKIILASSRELSLCSLAGLVLMLITPLLFIQPPSIAVCAMQKIIFGLSLTCCYAPLVLKTNRIYRIFLSSQNASAKKLLLVSLTSQFSMIAGMLAIQLLLSAFWIIKDKLNPVTTYPLDQDYGIKTCAIKADSFILNIIFPLVLMIASTFLAFKTRNLPDAFSEIKSIGVTMFITFFICMISLVLVFVIDGEKEAQFMFGDQYVLCFAYQMIALVTLIGHYAMKVKLIYGNNEFDPSIDAIDFKAITANKYTCNVLSPKSNGRLPNGRAMNRTIACSSPQTNSAHNNQGMSPSPKHKQLSL